MSNGTINIVLPEYAPAHIAFTGLSLAFKDALTAMGYTVNMNSHIDQSDADIELIIALIAIKNPNRQNPNKRYIVVQTEQLPTKQSQAPWQIAKWNELKKYIQPNDIIWDFFYPFHKHLYSNQSDYIKFGYHPRFDNFAEIEKKYDICFYGAPSDRRKNLMKDFGSKFSWQGNFRNIHSQNRIDIINSSRICLNIHYSASKLVELIRVVSHYLSNKAFVLSEPIIGHDWIMNKNLVVTSPIRQFDDKIRYFIKNEKERNELAEQSYQYLKTNHKMSDYIEQCMARL